MDVKVGSQLGCYELLGALGVGGMGEVYRARDLQLGRDVAIKVLRRGSADDEDQLARFQREARAASALSHPNIVTIYSFGTVGTTPYLAMELVNGTTLREAIEGRAIEPPRLFDQAAQISAGLAQAHSQGVLHRDLKPENLMVTDEGTIKILDFGLAKLSPGALQDSLADDSIRGRTTPGMLMGSVGYMSPEQACGDATDFRCDQFSLGVILYEMASGRRPFWGKTPILTLSAIIEGAPEPLARLEPDLPPAFVALVERLLSKAPGGRYDSTRTVALELQSLRDSMTSPPSSVHGTRLCVRCRALTMPGQNFCGQCGLPLDTSCSACGDPVTASSKFCGRCGHAVQPTTGPVGAEAPLLMPPLRAAPTPATAIADGTTALADGPTLLEGTPTPIPGGGGERRRVAVLTSVLSTHDVLLEQLDPLSLAPWMERLRSAAEKVAEDHGGVLHRFEDGEITLLFGLPLSREDDVVRAVRAAQELHRKTKTLGTELGGVSSEPPCLHSGLDAGGLVVRQLGPWTYSLSGEPVHLARRLASHAGADEILTSPEATHLIAPFFATEPIEPVAVRHHERPIVPHLVVGESGHRSRLEAAIHKGLSTFTGRDQELDILRRCMEGARAGRGHWVTVVGESGVGKSRLVYEFAKGIEAGSVRQVGGRCHYLAGHVPYQPFLEALREALGLDDETRALTTERVAESVRAVSPDLEDFLPYYLQLLSVSSPASPPQQPAQGESQRIAIMEGLAAFFTMLGRHKPTLMVLEDWHWVDPASQEVLQSITAMASSYPLLVVVIYRPHRTFEWSTSTPPTSVLLAPLDTQPTAAIIGSVLGVDAVPPRLADDLYQRTGGNPFFVEELCRTLREEGALDVAHGRVVLTDSFDRLQLPESVQAVIGARLDRLDTHAREVLRVASVIGDEFGRRILEHAFRRSPSVMPALETLKNLGLVRQTRVLPEATFRFHNLLTRQVAYEGLLRHQRKILHRVVGESLESLDGTRSDDQLDLLMHHFGEAEEWSKAIACGVRSARRLLGLSGFVEALEILDTVCFWLTKLPAGSGPAESDQSAIRVQVLLLQEEICETLGRRERQQRLIDQLLTELDPDAQAAEWLEVHRRQGELSTLLGRFDAAEAALAEALRLARASGDDGKVRRTLGSVGFFRWHQGRHAEARAANEESLEIALRAGRPEEIAKDLTNLSTVLRGQGEYEEALRCLQEAIQLLEGIGSPSSLSSVLNRAAVYYREAGDADAALAYLHRAVEIDRQGRSSINLVFDLAAIAGVQVAQGRIEESLASYREAVELARKIRYSEGLVRTLRPMGEVLVALERYPEALRCFREGAETAPQLELRDAEVYFHRQSATVRERMEDFADALASWKAVRRTSRDTADVRSEIEALEGMARAERRLHGDSESALGWLRHALDLAESLATPPDHRGELLNTIGIVEWSRGCFEEALQHYRQALQLFEEIGDHGHQALMLMSLGVTCRSLQRHAEAVRYLEQALRLVRDAGDQRLECQALAALGDVLADTERETEALECFRLSLSLRRATGDRTGEAWMRYKIGRCLASLGEADTAGNEIRGALSLAEALGLAPLRDACQQLLQ